jgi:hypothetical protein
MNGIEAAAYLTHTLIGRVRNKSYHGADQFANAFRDIWDNTAGNGSVKGRRVSCSREEARDARALGQEACRRFWNDYAHRRVVGRMYKINESFGNYTIGGLIDEIVEPDLVRDFALQDYDFEQSPGPTILAVGANRYFFERLELEQHHRVRIEVVNLIDGKSGVVTRGPDDYGRLMKILESVTTAAEQRTAG